MNKQFTAFIHKEFLHILRDRRTLAIMLAMPIVLLLLFGYAITTEVRNTRVAIVCPTMDETVKQIDQRIDDNKYFTVESRLHNANETDELFRKGKIDMALVFAPNFADELFHAGSASVQILCDGSEPNQASIRTGYIQQILMQYAQEKMGMAAPITVNTRMLYNPQSKSEYNFVPGVIGMILMLICCMLTSVSIVREKELGTMELLLCSPIPPIYIVIAKLVPYFTVGCVDLALILAFSKWVLCIPMAGSMTMILITSMLYIFVSLALGLFISNVVSSQIAAMLLSVLLIVPTLYLSGLVFTIESMPKVLQYISAVVPARWYIQAARKLLVQGVGAEYVMKETLILAIMATVLVTVSWKKFKIRL